MLGFNGVINSGLMKLGLIDAPLEFLLYNPIAVIITLAHAWVAFAILPIYVSLEKIDRSLLEAATDLGDTAWERFWHVTLPLSAPGIVSGSLVVFAWTFSAFPTPELLGGGRVKMIANVVKDLALDAFNWPGSAAFAALGLAVTMVLLVVTGRILGRHAA